jgi:hypothetical protein
VRACRLTGWRSWRHTLWYKVYRNVRGAVMRKSSRLAAVGFALVLPACLVCLSGLLRFQVPDAIIHPALVLGGALTALALNLVPVMRVRAQREDGSLVGRISLRLEGRTLNLALVAVSLLVIAVVLMYVFLENL